MEEWGKQDSWKKEEATGGSEKEREGQQSRWGCGGERREREDDGEMQGGSARRRSWVSQQWSRGGRPWWGL